MPALSPAAPANVQWDATRMTDTLLTGTMSSIMQRTAHDPPHSPLYEYVQSQRHTSPRAPTSPAFSFASEDSLDSMLTAATSVNNSVSEDICGLALAEDDIETSHLVYRLCRSLYKKALSKTEGGHMRGNTVTVDARHERNMSRAMDWMPLLHLFDPKSFYAYRENGMLSGGGGGDGNHHVPSMEVPIGLQRAECAREASRWLLDELEVEKLSGGNSNHVYRLGHPQFREKIILLRVYGGGDDEAIDRYRDVAAMKQMSRAQLSPAVLHTFRWGRVEEFMENVATGTTDMLIESASLLADVYGVLHEMHQLPVEPFFPESANKARFKNNAVLATALQEAYDGPGDYLQKNTQRLAAAITRQKSRDGATPASREEPAAGAGDDDGGALDYYGTETEAKVMEELCPTAFERASLRFLRLASPSLLPAYRGDFVRFATDEVMAVRRLLQQLGTPVVFSHNDLNPANILLSWRKVPKKFRLASLAGPTPATPTATNTSSVGGDDSSARLVDENDEVTSEVSARSNSISRKFLTKKGLHKNLVELKGIVFIDFEYTDANYRAVDLGNTLCELDYDYSRGMENGGPGFIKYLCAFPPAGFEEEWADKSMHYPRLAELIYLAWQQQQQQDAGAVTASSVQTMTDAKGRTLGIGASCLHAVSRYFQCERERAARPGQSPVPNGNGEGAAAAPPPVTREQLTEVLLGMLASQLHWSLWSFTLACNTDALTNQTTEDDTFAKGSSGLDYVRYGDCRLKEYLCLKAWMAEHGFI